jgi:hypothetical protein
MKRRDFLVAGVSMASAWAARSARGQPIKTRGAVVIGVDRVGNLQPLKSAGSGARSMAAWLAAEGFDVKPFVDAPNSPVRANDIFMAVDEFVRRGTLDQLVIYFGGHGFIKGTGDEFAVLSGALDNPSEAINLTDSQKFAWFTRIKNVVFISDACRSRADSLQTDAVSGMPIFPHKFGAETAQVDQFLATAIGAPAWEVTLRANQVDSAGIYTGCFLDAFKRPYTSSVKVVEGKSVVPNRLLQSYLEAVVPMRARAADPTLEQHPAARVCSSDITYIGSVSGTERLPEGTSPPTMEDVARVAVDAALDGRTPQYSAAARVVADASGFDSARSSLVVEARGLSGQLAARTGFFISGQRVESVTTRPGIRSVISNSSGGHPASKVEVDVEGPRAASVALRFTDGTGTVVAALDTYIANIVVEEGRVISVSYVPSDKSMMGRPSDNELSRLSQMHAAVATAAQFGVFRIDGPPAVRVEKARTLAGRIRVMKGIDPTLGLYAAYAYADVNLVEQVASVRNYMHYDLRNIDLFDVAMLAGDLAGKVPGNPQICPFCPMLSQGWGYLRVKEVRLPEGVAAASNHLRQSLWLTLDPEGMRIVESALGSGRVP